MEEEKKQRRVRSSAIAKSEFLPALNTPEIGSHPLADVILPKLEPVFNEVANEFEVIRNNHFNDLCEAFLTHRIDDRSIALYHQRGKRFLTPTIERALREYWNRHEVTPKTQAELIETIYRENPSDFELALSRVDQLVFQIRTTHGVLKLCMTKELREAFDQIRDFQSVDTNILKTELLKAADDLIERAFNLDAVGFAKRAVRTCLDALKSQDSVEQYVEMMRSLIVTQLDPMHLDVPGLSMEKVEEIYEASVPNGKKLGPGEQLTIYLLVSRILKTEPSGSSSLRDALRQAKLLHYARVHARLMELRMRLQSACSV